jgi:F-type H+-transporting ATPase subunit delta
LAIGEERGTLLGLQKEVERLAQVWDASEELRTVLTNPLVDLAARRKIWNEVILRSGISPIGKNFFRLLFDKTRLPDLPGISRELTALCDDRENRLRAKVMTAVPITDSDLMNLKLALQRQTGKAIVIEKKVDPSLLGGVITLVGDLMYDDSIKTHLARIKESMLGR